jgi:multidrug efflux system membrane fusion protein
MISSPFTRHRVFAAGFVAPLFAALVASCNRSAQSVRGPAAVPVQTAEAQLRTVPITQTAIGSVQALRSVAVKSQIDGVIAQVQFREGDEVKAGDLLIALDRRPFENSLRSAQADLANARAQEEQAAADAQRYHNLDQQAAVSKEQYAQYYMKAETARATVQAKEAALANAELQLGYTEIRAPIAGRTGQLNLHEGALVKANDAGQSIVTINQLAPISVAYSVPESVLGSVRAAKLAGEVKVNIVPHSTLSEVVQGRLDFIDNSVDPATGTILLKAVFDNADRRLWPGEFVDVTTVVGEEKDVVVVPMSAVQTGQNGSQVFVLKTDHSVELRPVKVGRQANENTVLREGVRPGEVVVTDGQLRLVSGTKVEVKSLGGTADEVAKAGADKPSHPQPPKS